MIKIVQWPIEAMRTPENSCAWEAECVIEEQRYSVRSRRGAPNELARVLVGFKIDDQPVELRTRGTAGCITYRSLHEMAKWTYKESAHVPLRRVRWKAPPDFRSVFGSAEAQNRGESDRDG